MGSVSSSRTAVSYTVAHSVFRLIMVTYSHSIQEDYILCKYGCHTVLFSHSQHSGDPAE